MFTAFTCVCCLTAAIIPCFFIAPGPSRFTQRYPKAKAINNDPKAANDNERRAHLEPTGTALSSQCAPTVVGGGRHFMSAYSRFFDNPEAHLFPTDYLPSPGQAAAAAALQRASGGGDGLQSPSKGGLRVLGSPPPSFASKSHQTHTEFEPEYSGHHLPAVCFCNTLSMYLHQHPLRTFTTSGFTALTQDRCYRTSHPGVFLASLAFGNRLTRHRAC